MEVQLSDLTTMTRELQTQNASIQRTLNDNLATLNDVGVWRPQIDAKVDELHKSVVDLQGKVERLISQPSASVKAA
jgi:chromosome condensin MukBEF complex kleisin-like MukF subunit